MAIWLFAAKLNPKRKTRSAGSANVSTDIEEDKIEASFKNGVLTVTLPKTERAQAKEKRIAVNSPTKH
jgi:HSP20 family molecular chaperone IbpA